MSKNFYNLKKQKIDLRDYIHKTDNNIQLNSSHFITDGQMISCPILDQGKLGSCLANATYALVYILSNGKINLSRLYLYMTTRAIDGSSLTQDSGGSIRSCMKAISKYNLCNENIWNYTISNFDKLPPLQAFTNNYKMSNYEYTFVNQDLLSIKTVLTSGNPIVFGIIVYSSFNSTNAFKYGLIPMPDIKKEKQLGGHALLLIGFHDDSKTFKFQNSWGTSWGDKGFGYIPYDYVTNKNLAFDLCTIKFNY
jgi:C1A family cysteine protease